tara:strand:+ start:260 stop:835 length:576 start_codon:yes stop_codon:yes gene_type:complete
MIDLENRHVHLSYEHGSGGTSFCLSIVKKVLKSGKRVIWLGRNIPDGERSSQILGLVSSDKLKKFMIMEIKENLMSSYAIIRNLLKGLNKGDLLVIDDWCAKEGRASKEDIKGLEEIIHNSEKCKIIISSTSYENLENKEKRWEERGGAKIRNELSTVFLYRDSEINNKRILKEQNKITIIRLLDSGFELF